jgi:hypothetical protein
MTMQVFTIAAQRKKGAQMKRNFALLICLGLLMAASSAVLAQGPGGDWISSIACQNLDSENAAEITLSFYPQGSDTVVASHHDSIPAGNSRLYHTTDADIGVPADFLGSVVVSSLQPVVCSVNTQNSGTGTSDDPYRIASSSGLDETEVASVMYAPQVMKAYWGWNSYISVQNASQGSISVQVSYKDRDGEDMPAAIETATIPGLSNMVFYQSENAAIPSDFVGAAKVTVSDPADAKMAVVVNFYNSGSDASTSQFHSYNGASAGAVKLYVPRVVRRFYGYNSGITIQNVSNIDTTVSLNFNFAGESFSYQSDTINPSTAVVLYLPDISEINAVDVLPISQRFGNAVIEVDNAEARIIAIINEDNRGNSVDNDGNPIPAERIGQGSSYSAIPAGTETKILYFPQVPNQVEGIFSGGFFFSNVSGKEGFCEIHFTGVPGAKIDDFDVLATESKSYYAPDIANLPAGFNASVKVVCTIEIIGIQNFAAAPDSGKHGDSFTQNNAFNE